MKTLEAELKHQQEHRHTLEARNRRLREQLDEAKAIQRNHHEDILKAKEEKDALFASERQQHEQHRRRLQEQLEEQRAKLLATEADAGHEGVIRALQAERAEILKVGLYPHHRIAICIWLTKC